MHLRVHGLPILLGTEGELATPVYRGLQTRRTAAEWEYDDESQTGPTPRGTHDRRCLRRPGSPVQHVAVMVRLLFLLSLLLPGTQVIVYLVLWVLMPNEDRYLASTQH